jgi:hypothetical protein
MSKTGTVLAIALLVSLTAGCNKAESTSKGSGAKPAAAPPADAQTIAGFKAANPQAGSRAKVHGYVGSTKGDAWPLVDKVGDTMPFMFCKMASPPSDVKEGSHVVAEGKVEDTAMLQECTLTAL